MLKSNYNIFRNPICLALILLLSACDAKPVEETLIPKFNNMDKEKKPEKHCYINSPRRSLQAKSKMAVAIDIGEYGALNVYRSTKAFDNEYNEDNKLNGEEFSGEFKDAIVEFKSATVESFKEDDSFVKPLKAGGHLDMEEFKGDTEIFFILFDDYWHFRENNPFTLTIDTGNMPNNKYYAPIFLPQKREKEKLASINYQHVSFNQGRRESGKPLKSDCIYKYNLHVTIKSAGFETEIIIDPLIKNTGLP